MGENDTDSRGPRVSTRLTGSTADSNEVSCADLNKFDDDYSDGDCEIVQARQCRQSVTRASGGVVVHHAPRPRPGPGHEKLRKTNPKPRRNREKHRNTLFFLIFS